MLDKGSTYNVEQENWSNFAVGSHNRYVVCFGTDITQQWTLIYFFLFGIPLWAVAATMRLAHCAGISTFVTGGIGGVHRNDNDDEDFNLDISADLTELARTPVIVVSAGIKSILDIARTLEVLET